MPAKSQPGFSSVLNTTTGKRSRCISSSSSVIETLRKKKKKRRRTPHPENNHYVLPDAIMRQLRGPEDETHFWIVDYLWKFKYRKYWDKKLCRGSIDDISLGRTNWSQKRRIKLLGQNNGLPDLEWNVSRGAFSRLLMEVKDPYNYKISDDQRICLRENWKAGAYCAIVMDKQSAERLLDIYMDESRHAELIMQWDKKKFPCPVWRDDSGLDTRFYKPKARKPNARKPNAKRSRLSQEHASQMPQETVPPTARRITRSASRQASSETQAGLAGGEHEAVSAASGRRPASDKTHTEPHAAPSKTHCAGPQTPGPTHTDEAHICPARMPHQDKAALAAEPDLIVID